MNIFIFGRLLMKNARPSEKCRLHTDTQHRPMTLNPRSSVSKQLACKPTLEFSLLLATAPSHACRLACDHNKTVSHGTVEFQPPSSPDLSLLFLWNELKTRFSIQLLPSRAELLALLTRVCHRTRTGNRWMFETMGKPWVRKPKAYDAANGVFSSSTGTADHIVPLKNTALHGTLPQTQAAPQTQPTHFPNQNGALGSFFFCADGRKHNVKTLGVPVLKN